MPYQEEITGNILGTYTFARDQYFNPNDPQSIANLTGAVTFSASLPPINTKHPTQYYVGFVQDDWKLRSNVTVNLGLRYERLYGCANEDLDPSIFPIPIPYKVLEASGRPMSVRTALALINQTLTEVLCEQEDEFDADTRWAIAWYEQHGFEDGEFGQAELLSKAKVTTVSALVEAGIVASKGGKVRLLRPEELRKDWDPGLDGRFTVWEATHHLVRVYYREKAGDRATAELLRKLGSRGETARDLAYRLFSLSEKKSRSQEAQAYNALVLGWPEVARLAREGQQGRLSLA